MVYRRGVVFEISLRAVAYVEGESLGDPEAELLDGVDLGCGGCV